MAKRAGKRIAGSTGGSTTTGGSPTKTSTVATKNATATATATSNGKAPATATATAYPHSKGEGKEHGISEKPSNLKPKRAGQRIFGKKAGK